MDAGVGWTMIAYDVRVAWYDHQKLHLHPRFTSATRPDTRRTPETLLIKEADRASGKHQ